MRSTWPRKTMWSPPRKQSMRLHSSQAALPRISGTPPMPASVSQPANLSSLARANWLEICTWSSARMFTTKRSASRNTGWLGAVSDWLHRISGGSSDTELKELTVRPCGLPWASTVVITVTPVTKEPRTWRSSRVSKGVLIPSAFHLLDPARLRGAEDRFQRTDVGDHLLARHRVRGPPACRIGERFQVEQHGGRGCHVDGSRFA